MKRFVKGKLVYVIITAAFAALFIAVLLYGYRAQEAQVWGEKQREMGYITEDVTNELQIMLQGYMALTEEAAGVTVEAGFTTRGEFVGYYQRFIAENQAADSAYLALDNTITYFDNWTAPEGYDPKIRAWYNQGKDGGGATVFSDPYIDGITGNLVVSSLKKVTMPDGTVGVVGTDISLAGLKSTVDAIRPTANGAAYLLGPDNMIITHVDAALVPKIVNDEESYTKMSDLAVEVLETSPENASITRIIDYDGVEKYNCVMSIPSVPGWSLGLAIPVSDFEADVDARIGSLLPFVALGGIVAVFCVVLAVLLVQDSRRRSHWYESILDAIPLPISVTDNNMEWTFVNKPVEHMLSVKRADVIGKQCSNWNAAICNTEQCGIACLRRGQNVTYFEQMGMSFKVDISNLHDRNGKAIGHIEVVQDISEMSTTQRTQTEMVDRINEVVNAFVDGSKQVASGAQALSQGSSEQTAAMEQLSASISDISRITADNAGTAHKAAKLAGTIKNSAEKGSQQMDEMMSAVREINDASQRISKVIKVIDDIAFQTNILALNAAVEAARAGQYGKGFAVVAEEVRNLAAKSAEAAKDTGSLIANSMEKAGLGARIANETAASLAEIVSGINESTQLVGEIAKSSEQQSIGISQINDGVEQVAQVVQQTNATAEESAASAKEMSGQADALDSLISQFKSRSANDARDFVHH